LDGIYPPHLGMTEERYCQFMGVKRGTSRRLSAQLMPPQVMANETVFNPRHLGMTGKGLLPVRRKGKRENIKNKI